MITDTSELTQAATAIRSADAILVTAGAGVGVDSGLPDFRGPEGFWRAYPHAAKLGLSFEDLANPSWFKKDPALGWAFYGHRLNLYRETVPHAGFTQLLEIASSKPNGYFVFTSNVDGQFQKAGFSPERIVECHGSINHFQCVTPCSDEIWDAPAAPVRIDPETFRALEPLPRCPRCGKMARPNILMFGDWVWIYDRTSAQEERFNKWLAGLEPNAAKLVVIELGAGNALPTVRHISERVAARFRAPLIRINPRDNAVPKGQISILLGAAEAISGIVNALRNL